MTHLTFTMLCKARQIKNDCAGSCREALCLANDAFMKADKSVVESELVGFFIDGLYHDFLCMKVMREKPKKFRLWYNLHWQNTIWETDFN